MLIKYKYFVEQTLIKVCERIIILSVNVLSETVK